MKKQEGEAGGTRPGIQNHPGTSKKARKARIIKTRSSTTKFEIRKKQEKMKNLRKIWEKWKKFCKKFFIKNPSDLMNSTAISSTGKPSFHKGVRSAHRGVRSAHKGLRSNHKG